MGFVGPTGVRHAVEVTAESLYEAAVLGLNVLRQSEWADQIAPGTPIEVHARAPATIHVVTIVQLRRWVDGVAVSPNETLKKQKLKALLT